MVRRRPRLSNCSAARQTATAVCRSPVGCFHLTHRGRALALTHGVPPRTRARAQLSVVQVYAVPYAAAAAAGASAPLAVAAAAALVSGETPAGQPAAALLLGGPFGASSQCRLGGGSVAPATVLSPAAALCALCTPALDATGAQHCPQCACPPLRPHASRHAARGLDCRRPARVHGRVIAGGRYAPLPWLPASRCPRPPCTGTSPARRRCSRD